MCPSVKGVCYIRTSRQDSPIIYNSNEDFHVGQAKVRRLSACISVCKSQKSLKTLLRVIGMTKKKIPFPLPGGVPEQRGPGDFGGSWSDFARGPGCSWTFKERYNTLNATFEQKNNWILYLLNYLHLKFSEIKPLVPTILWCDSY